MRGSWGAPLSIHPPTGGSGSSEYVNRALTFSHQNFWVGTMGPWELPEPAPSVRRSSPRPASTSSTLTGPSEAGSDCPARTATARRGGSMSPSAGPGLKATNALTTQGRDLRSVGIRPGLRICTTAVGEPVHLHGQGVDHLLESLQLVGVDLDSGPPVLTERAHPPAPHALVPLTPAGVQDTRLRC